MNAKLKAAIERLRNDADRLLGDDPQRADIRAVCAAAEQCDLARACEDPSPLNCIEAGFGIVSMIPQTKLDQLRKDVSHTPSDALFKINAAVLADALTELWCWRRGGVTEEMLRAADGCIKIGRGCLIVRDEGPAATG